MDSYWYSTCTIDTWKVISIPCKYFYGSHMRFSGGMDVKVWLILESTQIAMCMMENK